MSIFSKYGGSRLAQGCKIFDVITRWYPHTTIVSRHLNLYTIVARTYKVEHVNAKLLKATTSSQKTKDKEKLKKKVWKIRHGDQHS